MVTPSLSLDSSEFWRHFFKALELPEFETLLGNAILMPNELHVRKHVIATLFQCASILAAFWVPLLTSCLV
jgi:hypothetical protein